VREYSIPTLVDIPAAASLADVVFTRASQDPHAVIMRKLSDGSGRWEDVTAGEFRDEVIRLAKGLIAAGIEPGDRVALMSRTRYEWTLIDYAIWAAGGVTVPVYETSSAFEVEWILSDSGARAAFAETSKHAEIIGEIRGNAPALEQVWPIEGASGQALGPDPGDVTDEQVEQRRTSRKAADLATIVYTSGTTGRPKGCEITHLNLLSGARNACQGALVEFEVSESSTLLFLPLAHVFARIIQVGCLESGAILGHWPDTRTVAQALPEFKPTFLLAVPRVFEKVYNTAQQQAAASQVKSRIFGAAVETAVAWSQSQGTGGSEGRTGAALRLRHALFDRLVYTKLRAAIGGQVGYAISGGAPLGERLGHFFRGAGITILEGYGLTETAAAAIVNKPSRNKIGTVGLPLPGGGVKNVAPAVLEDRLRAHPLISQSLVVGDQRPYIASLITLDPEALEFWKNQHDHPADADVSDDPELIADIQSAVDDANKAVSRAESIRRFRILSSDFTESNGYLTPSLKVRRNVVIKDYGDEIDALYAQPS